jgi:RNA polymerase sigma-70 factor (ECF subfamily)
MEVSSSQRRPASHADQLVEEAHAGSAAARGELLELCRRYLLLIANQKLETELQAKGGASDLVQETFLEAHRDFAQFEGKTHAEVLAWLRQILLNNLSNFRRRYAASDKREISRELSLDGSGPDGELKRSLATDASSPSGRAAANEESAALDRAVGQLAPEYQEAILLRHEQGLSFAEIGLLMDRSADAARKIWARAICRLREELDER